MLPTAKKGVNSSDPTPVNSSAVNEFTDVEPQTKCEHQKCNVGFYVACVEDGLLNCVEHPSAPCACVYNTRSVAYERNPVATKNIY